MIVITITNDYDYDSQVTEKEIFPSLLLSFSPSLSKHGPSALCIILSAGTQVLLYYYYLLFF
jgi:hypothetical protein